ncbi:MAG: teichuronic acid biosynthesis glycosyltransferase TuaG, partial [Polaribacter sp.]
MKNNLVSIITPNYNSENYIEETLQSIIAQSYKNWELLIVDDCSTDKSLDI